METLGIGTRPFVTLGLWVPNIAEKLTASLLDLEQLTKLYNEAQAHLSRLDTRLTGGEDVGEDTGENAAAPL